MEFKQSEWMAPYILINTQFRQAAKSSFEKNLYKFFSNAVYGKSLQNERKQCDVRIVGDVITAERLVAKNSFKAFHQINDDFTMVELCKSQIRWMRPIYVGFVVLEISKLLMYEFHYDVMKPLFKNDITLLFTDTDSFCYNIKTLDLYHDLKEIAHHLDTSDYPPDHPLYSTVNKKVV